MTIGLSLNNITDEIGTADFFHAFFSTISGKLEPRGWGTRFPVLMTVLYRGSLPQSEAEKALDEIKSARAELAELDPSHVIWDIEDPAKRPPWGDDISGDITSLGNYFVTSSGRDLFDVLVEITEELRDGGGVIEVTSY